MEAGAGLERGVSLSLDENRVAGNDAVAQLPKLAGLPSPASGVRLWWCALHATSSQLRSCANALSAAEHARAARFGSPLLRDRYVVGRAALRAVLAEVLGVTAGSVAIVRAARSSTPVCRSTSTSRTPAMSR